MRSPPGAVVLLGATSVIGRATAAAFARRGHPLVLMGRDADELDRVVGDLAIRSAVPVHSVLLDALDHGAHAAAVERAWSAAGPVEGVVSLLGEMDDPGADAVAGAVHTLEANLVAPVALITAFAERLAEGGSGWIAIVSSVAGERGRQSNYLYGAAKSGLTTFASGLRNRLWHRGVHVLTVIPGFLDTRMTYGRPGVRGAAAPEQVGEAVARAVRSRRNVVYVPRAWRWVMLVIRAIPEPLFKRLRL